MKKVLRKKQSFIRLVSNILKTLTVMLINDVADDITMFNENIET